MDINDLYLRIKGMLYGPGESPEEILRAAMKQGDLKFKDLAAKVAVLKVVDVLMVSKGEEATTTKPAQNR